MIPPDLATSADEARLVISDLASHSCQGNITITRQVIGKQIQTANTNNKNKGLSDKILRL